MAKNKSLLYPVVIQMHLK